MSKNLGLEMTRLTQAQSGPSVLKRRVARCDSCCDFIEFSGHIRIADYVVQSNAMLSFEEADSDLARECVFVRIGERCSHRFSYACEFASLPQIE